MSAFYCPATEWLTERSTQTFQANFTIGEALLRSLVLPYGLTSNMCDCKVTTHMLKCLHTFAELQLSVTTLFIMSARIIRIK